MKGELKSRDTIIETLQNDNSQKPLTDGNTLQSNAVTKKNVANDKQTVKRGNFQVTISKEIDDIYNEYDSDNDNLFITPSNKKNNDKKNNDNQKRTTTILGDSTIKDIQAYKMRRRLPKNEKLFVKSFSGATVQDMVDYVKPSMRRKPDLIILHAGTNDLRSEKSAEIIASEIMNLALEMKCDTNDVMVSGIISRGDKLNNKGVEVNQLLVEGCKSYNLNFINNSNLLSSKHLNGSGLHLNFRGTISLAGNFIENIKV